MKNMKERVTKLVDTQGKKEEKKRTRQQNTKETQIKTLTQLQ